MSVILALTFWMWRRAIGRSAPSVASCCARHAVSAARTMFHPSQRSTCKKAEPGNRLRFLWSILFFLALCLTPQWARDRRQACRQRGRLRGLSAVRGLALTKFISAKFSYSFLPNFLISVVFPICLAPVMHKAFLSDFFFHFRSSSYAFLFNIFLLQMSAFFSSTIIVTFFYGFSSIFVT